VDVVDWAATSEEFQKIIAQNHVVIQKPASTIATVFGGGL
jgi:hypothetical protein